MKTKFNGILTLLLAFVVQITFAQERTISGTVSDDTDVLSDVNVVIKGTNVGTTTDFDGKYSINAKTGDVLVFSFVGYQTAEKVIGGSNTVDVTLNADGEIEVVIKTLGRDVEARTATFAVQSVNGEDFTKARETNVANALSGKVSGVQVTSSSGAVGASSRVILRGASSLTGNNQPLYVIDGVPIDNANTGNAGSGGGTDAPTGVADINPDDIESLSVLKGPAAAALYGVRASNGVIVIKTKRGKQGDRLGIDFNTSLTFENPLILPKFQNSYGQGSNPDYFQWIDGASGDGGVDESWGPPLDIGLNFVQWDSYIDGNNGQALPWVSRPDNIKSFYDTGITLNNSVSFSGGSDNGAYRFSIGNMNQKGTIPFTDYRRFTVGTSASREFGKFTSTVSINYTKGKSDNLPVVGYTSENPVQQMIWGGRNTDWDRLRDWRSLPLATAGVADGTPLNWNTQYQNNPFWVLETNKNTFNKDRIVGNVGLDYKFNDNFSMNGSLGMDHFSQLQTRNQAIGTDGGNGFYRETRIKRTETNANIMGTYNKDLTDDLNFEGSLGGNMMKVDYKYNYQALPGLEIPGLYNLSNLRSGEVAVSNGSVSERRINSLYGIAKLGYKNYLFLEFTGRNDWLSVLPLNNNSFFYPSITASAVLSDIFEFQDSPVNFLKVRGGWAKVGGAGILGAYSLQPTYNLITGLGVTTASNANTLFDPNIKPESTAGIELGLDSRLFDNRIKFNLTYYDQKSTDQIVNVQLSSASGYSGAIQNVGEMHNKGIELGLGAKLVDKKDWGIDLDLNWAKNTNEVVTLGGDTESLVLGGQWGMTLEARPGEAYGSIVGTFFSRDDNGNVIYEDGLPTYTTETKVLGNITPDWTGGANLSVRYKNFTFSTLVDAKIGGDVFSMTNAWGRYAGVLEETLIGRETGVVGNGVMLDPISGTYVPNNVARDAESFNKAAYNNSITESSVFDASYVKLRQMQIGYNLPSKLLKNTPVDAVSFSLVGRNLAVLYRKSPHIDPETSFSDRNGEQGQEFGQLPSNRSIGFNINVKF